MYLEALSLLNLLGASSLSLSFSLWLLGLFFLFSLMSKKWRLYKDMGTVWFIHMQKAANGKGTRVLQKASTEKGTRVPWVSLILSPG